MKEELIKRLDELEIKAQLLKSGFLVSYAENLTPEELKWWEDMCDAQIAKLCEGDKREAVAELFNSVLGEPRSGSWILLVKDRDNLIDGLSEIFSLPTVSEGDIREKIAEELYMLARQGSINIISFAKQHGIELDPLYESTEPLPEWENCEPIFQQIWLIYADQHLMPLLNAKVEEDKNVFNDIEKQHIIKALKEYYEKTDEWCSVCDNIMEKLTPNKGGGE